MPPSSVTSSSNVAMAPSSLSFQCRYRSGWVSKVIIRAASPLRSNEHYNACLFDVKQYDAELALFRIFYVFTPAACCRAYVKRQLRIFRLAAQAIKPELRLLHFGLRRCVAANQGN